jgi:nicotinamidase-related amidase
MRSQQQPAGGVAMDRDEMLHSSGVFLKWALDWYEERPKLDLASTVRSVGGPDKVAVLAVDVTLGFCSYGPLSSPRVGRIVEPVVRLFELAHSLGVRHYLLPQDTHSADAIEFESFPAHCLRGTDESHTVPELASLPFSRLFRVIQKDSISSAIGTELDTWLADHSDVNTFFVAGDCTDFCVYQLAMHLRLRANAFGLREARVIVPIDTVDTFDLPVELAHDIGALPHHADLMHLVFLFSMAQNGVEIVGGVH